MKVRVSNWRFSQKKTTEELLDYFNRFSGLHCSVVRSLEIIKEAQDLRKGITIVYTVEVDMGEDIDLESLRKKNSKVQINEVKVELIDPTLDFINENSAPKGNACVIGSGPAGSFAAYALALSGHKVKVFERGKKVEDRFKDVKRLFEEGIFDEKSNICFGEGGAGTFSDGKLTTRKKHPWIRWLLKVMVECGAPESILTASKPHIGSDRLRLVAINFRKKLQAMGVEFHFETCITDFEVVENKLVSLKADDGRVFEDPGSVVWASGHSARDSYRLLHEKGLSINKKAFAVGVRIEHPQSLVNDWIYQNEELDEAANYSVTCNFTKERSVYSFCMCPGGQVVCSSSHEGYNVVNGMSNYARSEDYANAGIVVKVSPDDFKGEDALAGITFQEKIEKLAFEASLGQYAAPAQLVTDFLDGVKSEALLPSSFKPKLVPAELGELFPEEITHYLREALVYFDGRYPGFAGKEAQLIGVETRTSSPVTIVRDEKGVSPEISNFYPCGEGAGYAGGIISAALDGLFIAKCIKDMV